MTNKEAEIYIHIPFCVRKCAYCDFLSFAADEEARQNYVAALKHEIAAACADLRDRQIRSIFIGGGTPSLLSPQQLESIFEMLFRCANIGRNAEITLECNPGTADREKLKDFRSLGVNRLSIGAQSFDDRLLQTIGRIHNSEQIENCFENARQAGFENINLDLIFSLPGQTEEDWKNDLNKAVSLRPEHISAYSLSLEEGTPLFEKKADYVFPDEDTDRSMYYAGGEILADHGYQQYEISNYSLPGMECLHNKGYWEGTEYLGLGLGAASLVNHVRFRNTDSMEDYLSGAEFPGRIRIEEERLDRTAQMSEFIILGLRMTEGISTEEFEKRFGKSIFDEYGPILEKYSGMGLMELKNRRLRLSKEGIYVSNTIFTEFL